MADVTERMLALLSTLQDGQEYTGGELAERLGTSPRTLRRDIDRLRGYGYPVDTRPGRGGFYRLGPGRDLPPLLLDDDEAVATLLGLALLAATGDSGEGGLDAVATRAYGKIDQLLPRRLRPRATAIRTALEAGHQLAPATSPQVLADLSAAVQHRRTTRFAYRGAAGAVTERHCEPHRVVHLNQRWYLLAWDLDRSDWRVFRSDRISELRTGPEQFVPRPIPAGSAVDFLRQGLSKERLTVRLTVEAPLLDVADALRREDAEFVALAADRTAVTLALDNWQWLLLNLAFLDAEFTVHEPPAFRAACRTFAQRVERATG